ncbi:lasso peptide biosynthesis B2 protein [Luteimonas fraxinea]|uniref:lasso peptide biosynthesis B2 protein n=1 Tax=Luteimonas fraxinea TaxID=2901869 RepID=UPI001E458D9A|nr:lasso peptide biosynthesis B2 protein [Luteimonas fraxinea]MCD9125783.1 lasso peptide biosynthesis B2 protein [Luteimonas fraxinea]
MPYRIANAVSYCEIDGQLIFLDLESDRYFRLSEALEIRFRAFVQTGETSPNALAELATHRVLVDAQDGELLPRSFALATPHHSAIEREDSSARTALLAVPEVAAVVAYFRSQLRSQRVPLLRLIARASAYRQRHTGHRRGLCSETDLLRAVEAFTRARLLVPIEPRCLLDSLSLLRFLARRGLYAHLIFGVSMDPFAAHCWLQTDDLVLNDSVGNVMAHTPIRTV